MEISFASQPSQSLPSQLHSNSSAVCAHFTLWRKVEHKELDRSTTCNNKNRGETHLYVHPHLPVWSWPIPNKWRCVLQCNMRGIFYACFIHLLLLWVFGTDSLVEAECLYAYRSSTKRSDLIVSLERGNEHIESAQQCCWLSTCWLSEERQCGLRFVSCVVCNRCQCRAVRVGLQQKLLELLLHSWRPAPDKSKQFHQSVHTWVCALAH